MMKKRCVAGLALTAMLLCLCACVATPEKPIVAQKDADRLKEQAAEESTGNTLGEIKKDTPAHYEWVGSDADGSVTIVVDAEVSLPEADAMPSYEVAGGGWTQEQVDSMIQYLYPGEPIYDPNTAKKGKPYYEAQILSIKEKIAALEIGETLPSYEKESDVAMEDWEQILSHYEQLYADAPEEDIPPQESDGKFRALPEGGASVDVCDREINRRFDVGNLENDWIVPSFMQFLREDTNYELNFSNAALVTDGEPLPENAEKVGITYEQARALADGFIVASGENMAAYQCYLLDDSTPEQGSMTDLFHFVLAEGGYAPGREATDWAYLFYYVRQTDGLPLVPNMGCRDVFSQYSVAWNDENVFILVDGSGISTIMWDNPLAVGAQVSDNCGLMDFAAAADIFQTISLLHYKGETSVTWSDAKCAYKVQVSEIRLQLMRVRTGADRTGMLIPAWAFYGTVEQCGSPFEQNNTQCLSYGDPVPIIIGAVNAIDGTYIETMAFAN